MTDPAFQPNDAMTEAMREEVTEAYHPDEWRDAINAAWPHVLAELRCLLENVPDPMDEMVLINWLCGTEEE